MILFNPDQLKFTGNVKEIITELNRLHVKKGDILLLRFNPLNVGLTADLIKAYTMKIHQASKGMVSVIPMPQGLTLEKVGAELRECITQEVMYNLKCKAEKEMEEAGISPDMTQEEVLEVLGKEVKKDATP
tara:strand:+ start:391 stop:783 length:393 start_codon:yes stop_codon:yes gene_type:complete